MKRIKQLPNNLINKIAAGEVIERPANVVKELVENSIDAGGTKIEINVSNDCRDFRVADNGAGIHPDDIELAFTKHATSKLTDENSLFNIETLGFRGEALASIISVAKVTCITRTCDFEYGIKAEAENSQVKFTQTGCAQGTVMVVKDLFFSQPARLKFIKNSKTEFSYIQEYIQALAISHPQIGFILKNNNQDVINTTPNVDLKVRISQIYNSDILQYLKEVIRTDKQEDMSITGYVSVPSYTRSSRNSIYTFVNSRAIKCKILTKAIDNAYKNMIPAGRYPFVVLNININPNKIDVNAHPTKKEIRYENPNLVFNFVQKAIEDALAVTNIEQGQNEEINQNIAPLHFIKNDDEFFNEDNNFKKNILPSSQSEDNNSDKSSLTPSKSDNNKNILEISNPAQMPIIDFNTQNQENDIKIIGQYDNTYIIVENEDTLEIIDQHIADERYIYETLKKQKKIISQCLIISDILDIEPQDAAILANAKEHLAKFGYQIEKISDTQIIFKKIPQVLSKISSADILAELLKNLRNSPENDLDSIEERILITTACKAAIKAGEKLTLFQMEEIVRKLRTTRNPYTCPHGRPISHYFTQKEVASFFSRNV